MPVSHFDCVSWLKESQEAETDNREMSREADLFLNKRDGQWEPQVLSKWANRPRYTFDECNPIVDAVMGDLHALEYAINVAPTGGNATKKVAEYFSGIIRYIENISGAPFIYDSCARLSVGTGLSAWRIKTKLRDGDSFNQDLMIEGVPNAQDTVWFDPGAVDPTMKDAEHAWVLTSLTGDQYEKRWPKGSRMSVGSDIRQQAYSHKKPDEIMVGEYLYKKPKTKELALLSNRAVVEVNDNFLAIYDDLQRSGISIVSTKTRSVNVVYQRFFDGADWLTGEKDSVFEYIPIIPAFGNFTISENKVVYWGLVEKLMDSQRVINYSESRKIEEGALAPKGKVWMSKEQAKSPDVVRTLATLNTNNDPVQFFDNVEGQMPPAYVGSPPSNPGLMETSQSAQNFIQRSSGQFDEARGTAPPRRSGIAIEHLQNKSDSPKLKWISMMERALTHTYEILIKAIPKVYGDEQDIRILNPDKTDEIITINQKIVDQDTGRIVTINDLSLGKYGVTCVAGPAFKTKQQETVNAITEYAAIDPSIIQFGADILLNNINAPGIDKLAARKRRQMVLQGLIPSEQMTEEEKTLLEQMNSQDDMTPIDKANLMIAQAQLADVQGRNEERAFKMELEQQKLALKEQSEQSKQMLDTVKALSQQLEVQAKTLKYIKDATGVEVIVNKTAMEAYDNQAKDLNEFILTN